MSTNTKETEAAIQARLAQIAAAVATVQRANGPQPEAAKNKAFAACPIDPAERALCDSCQ
jgi:hypothetical protein